MGTTTGGVLRQILESEHPKYSIRIKLLPPNDPFLRRMQREHLDIRLCVYKISYTKQENEFVAPHGWYCYHLSDKRTSTFSPEQVFEIRKGLNFSIEQYEQVRTQEVLGTYGI